MRSPTRILVPVLAAVLAVGGMLTYLSLQLRTASDIAQKKAATPSTTLTASVGQVSATDDTGNGDRALLHLRQGDVFAMQGDWKSAETEYKASVDVNGGIPALKKLAQAQLQRREMDAARSTIDELQTEGAKVEDLLLFNVLIDLRTGEVEQAKTLLAQAGDSPQKHYGLALLAIIQGNHDQAKSELQLVANGWEPTLRTYAHILQDAYGEFALFPESRDIHLETLISRALAQVQECELALPILADVTTAQDDYRDAWIVQGYCDLTTERYDKALSSLERAYALDPEKPEIQYFLGRTYAAQNDHKNAITFLQYALRNGFEPQKEVRRMIAIEAQAAGDSSLAFEEFRTIATASGTDIESVQAFVRVAIQAQKNDDALAAATKAVSTWPDSAKAYDTLGWADVALGKKDDARAAFEKALQLDASLDDAKQSLLNLGAMK